MVHAKELLAFGPQDQNQALPASAVRPLITATETTTRQEALVIMRKNKTHLVVLENSAGQPQGLITMEDIVQELMGE
jgi:CBS domain containing-hemolysin-like protein